MKTYLSLLILLIIQSGVQHQVYAQQTLDDDDHQLSMSVPDLSLITIMPTNYVVKLELELPSRAGGEPNSNDGSNVNSSSWINYSTTLKKKLSQKKVLVQVTSGQIPKGTAIELTASESSTGTGKRGSPSNTIKLSTTQQTLINGIGGASTGQGSNFGHKLTYKLVLEDLNKLEFEEPDTFITVTYTLTD